MICNLSLELLYGKSAGARPSLRLRLYPTMAQFDVESVAGGLSDKVVGRARGAVSQVPLLDVKNGFPTIKTFDNKRIQILFQAKPNKDRAEFCHSSAVTRTGKGPEGVFWRSDMRKHRFFEPDVTGVRRCLPRRHEDGVGKRKEKKVERARRRRMM